MFKINGNTIQITRGDTGIFTLSILSDGKEYDYSNDTVVFSVKTNVYTSKYLFQKEITYGSAVVIEPSDTANLSYGNYVYDVQVTTASGVVDTVIVPSKFSVLPEVTFGGNNG